jgi:hypothetical protein
MVDLSVLDICRLNEIGMAFVIWGYSCPDLLMDSCDAFMGLHIREGLYLGYGFNA